MGKPAAAPANTDNKLGDAAAPDVRFCASASRTTNRRQQRMINRALIDWNHTAGISNDTDRTVGIVVNEQVKQGRFLLKR